MTVSPDIVLNGDRASDWLRTSFEEYLIDLVENLRAREVFAFSFAPPIERFLKYEFNSLKSQRRGIHHINKMCFPSH